MLIALGVVFVARTRSRRASLVGTPVGRPESSPAAVIDTTPYRASVQEGLGASVAILLDQSGSMKDAPRSGGDRAKYRIAREALAQVLEQTDAFVARQPDFPVNVGLYVFARSVTNVLPIARYNRAALHAALESLPDPGGSTAIGRAMETAVGDLYRAGTIRKYLLVVTDGENTTGPRPEDVAREIERRSEGAVRLYLVAFDVDAGKFRFVNAVHGVALEARDGVALRANLDTLYRGRILAEAVDAGEKSPAAADTTKKLLLPTHLPPPR
jgi:hypothetical protein